MKQLLSQFTLISLLFLTSCKSTGSIGARIKDSDIDYLKSHPSKDAILDKVGSPSLGDTNTWYYIYIQTTKSALTMPKVTAQKIIKVDFNNSIASNVEILENSNNDVGMLNVYTSDKKVVTNPFKEFFGNLGRFNKSVVKKKK